jgi:hypothetical protein
MILLSLKNRHQLVPLSVKILQPSFHDSFLLEYHNLFLILFGNLPIIDCPLLKYPVEPLHGLSPLKLPDPYLPLLNSSEPLHEHLLACVSRMYSSQGFEVPLLLESFSPLAKENWLYFGGEESLE